MWVNSNGHFYPAAALPIAAGDPALQYGVSLFETMRWTGGRIPLLTSHFSRLMAGAKLLQIPLPPTFNTVFLHEEIKNLVKKNQVKKDARIRLQIRPCWQESFCKADPGLQYKIESFACHPLYFNDLGVKAGVAHGFYRPLPHPYCAFKTGNYLPYFMAAREARQRGLADVLMCNEAGRIGEASAANVFWVQNGQLYTPPLAEPIVAGVGRARLIEVLFKAGVPVVERLFRREVLQEADSLYLTNAFRGLRWVAQCDGIRFEKGAAEDFFRQAFSILTA